MSSTVSVFIDDEHKPPNIPSFETIVEKSFELRPSQTTAINISGVRISLDPAAPTSDNEVSSIWVKFGRGISMAEARTQRFVQQYLEENEDPSVRAPRVYLAFTCGAFGFIVSEYIDGKMCSKSDIPLVASAVQSLINIPSPKQRTPGPVGGGLIEHPFFVDGVSSIWYDSVEDLQDHINGILTFTERIDRADFTEEIAIHGLRLCVSDLELVNFMKDGGSKIVTIDFGGYSFLPPSFFAFALNYGRLNGLRQYLFKMLKLRPYETLGAMVGASCALAPFSSNDVGERANSLIFYLHWLSFNDTELDVLDRPSAKAQTQA